jgi:hypothetical protein
MHGHAPYHAMCTEYMEGMRHGSGSASHFQVYAAMHDSVHVPGLTRLDSEGSHLALA